MQQIQKVENVKEMLQRSSGLSEDEKELKADIEMPKPVSGSWGNANAEPPKQASFPPPPTSKQSRNAVPESYGDRSRPPSSGSNDGTQDGDGGAGYDRDGDDDDEGDE